MNTGELFGKEVLDMDANSVGKVSDMEFDINKGIIHWLTVKAGINKKYYISIEQIGKVGDKIILRIAKSELSAS